MDDQLCFLDKYYLYYTDTGETQVYQSNANVYTEFVYATSSKPNRHELNQVRLDDGTVEYVEQLDTEFHVYKEIPKHWLVRILSA